MKKLTEKQVIEIAQYIIKQEHRFDKFMYGLSAITDGHCIIDLGNPLTLLELAGYKEIVDEFYYWLYECNKPMEVTIKKIKFNVHKEDINSLVRLLKEQKYLEINDKNNGKTKSRTRKKINR